MKILIVNTSDISGGAARAAFRMHKALLSKEIDSKMLVAKKDSNDLNVIEIYGKWTKIVFFFRSKLETIFWRFYKNKTKTLFSSSLVPFSGIVRGINKINPDIVHLHWVCAGTMSIRDISRIKVPIVWTLQDMWAFTGGCHYDEDCGAYKDKCGNCKVLGSKKKKDLSSFVWGQKNKYFSKIKNMNIVTISSWLNKCSKKSSLFSRLLISTIPNSLDTNKFKPLDSNLSRELFNFPKNKKIILFGAMGATSDERKGFSELSKALNQINLDNVEIVVFGSSGEKGPSKINKNVKYLGYLNDDVSLCALYNASDVMIVPSIQEAFGQTASEAMSCGTPVVAFNATGLRDIVEHKVNGYLAKPFDPADLARGIEWVLNNENYEELCENAREKVLREFDSSVVADKYIKLYKDILSKNKNERQN